MTETFDFHNLLRIKLTGTREGACLDPLFEPLLVKDDTEPNLVIHCCVSDDEVLRGTGRRVTGSYKGVAWSMRIDAGDDTEVKAVWFKTNAACFSFLMVRLIVLPLLRNKALDVGGFVILGSVFRWKGQTFFVSGVPGSGKSKVLLQAIERGAEFVGDNEIIVDRDGVIKAVFNEIELRRATIYGNVLWRRLSFLQKCYLHSCGLLSALTLHKISFNLSIQPDRLRIATVDGCLNDDAMFVLLNPGSEECTVDSIVGSLLDYEKQFHNIYGFCMIRRLDEYLDKYRANALKLLGGLQCRSLKPGTGFDEIVSLGSTVNDYGR